MFKKIFVLFVFLVVLFGVVMSVDATTNITINPSNNTLSNVVNNYDIIYLDNGIYNGSSNKNININKNTAIIGLSNDAIIDAETKSGYIFNVKEGVRLTITNLTLMRSYRVISNNGICTINNTNFVNNSALINGIIYNGGQLSIYNSNFNQNIGEINLAGNGEIIENTIFTNNFASAGIIFIDGYSKLVKLKNLTFINNSAYYALIHGVCANVTIDLSDSKFINTNASIILLQSTTKLSNVPSEVSKVLSNAKVFNITEINTTTTHRPNINLEVYLKSNNLIVFKTTLKDAFGVLPNRKVFFYVNGKVVGSAVTDKNGVATFNYKRSNLNFALQVVFNAHTTKNSTTTAIFNGAIFKGSPSKYLVGKSKVVFKLKSTKKKGKYIYKKYYIYNTGSSLGSKTFKKKISSKYKVVKFKYKKLKLTYKKSKKTYYVKVDKILPYKFNKKYLSVLTVVLKKKN